VSRGSKGLLFGGAFLAFVWVLLVAFLALTGEDPAGGSTAERAAGQARSPEPTSYASPEPTVPEPTTGGSAPAAPGASDPFGTPADTDDADTDDAAALAPPADEAGRPSGEAPGDSSDAEEDGPGEDSPPDDGPAGGASPEPVSDERAPVELSEIEQKRAEAAAFNFLRYAYGYTGETREQYEAYVNQAVVPDTFRDSPGASVVEDFAENVSSGGGVKSTLLEQDIEISPSSKTRAVAATSFVLEDPSGTRRFEQKLEVMALGPIWKVSGAGPLVAAAGGGGEQP
jgi:hypothetical protein